MELLALKKIIFKMKNLVDGLTGGLRDCISKDQRTQRHRTHQKLYKLIHKKEEKTGKK